MTNRHYICITLNNDMTHVIEQNGENILSYVCMGSNDTLDLDDVLGKKERIDQLELLSFLQCPSVKDIYEKQQREHIIKTFQKVAEENNYNNLQDYDYELLADRYIAKQDYNITYDNQMEDVLNDYTSYER